MRIRSVDIDGFKIWAARGLLMETSGSFGNPETGLYLTVEDFKIMRGKYSPKAIVKMLGELLIIAESEYDEISRKEEEVIAKRRSSPKTTPPKEKVGHLYITKTSIGTKIGISDTGNIDDRMKTYRMLPIDIHETRIYTVYGYRNAERRLHDHFKDKRKSGEWFYLTDAEINNAEEIVLSEYTAQKMEPLL